MMIDFEYDPRKSEANLQKHGIALREAVQLWSTLSVEIEARSEGESRSMIIGILKGRLFSCIYTRRGEIIRLISLRRSRKKEEKIYYEHIQKEEDNERGI